MPSDPIASVNADRPCTITNLGSSVLVEREGVGTRQVRIQMTSRVTYTSEVRFTGGGGCCPYTNFGAAGPLEPLDAGPDSG